MKPASTTTTAGYIKRQDRITVLIKSFFRDKYSDKSRDDSTRIKGLIIRHNNGFLTKKYVKLSIIGLALFLRNSGKLKCETFLKNTASSAQLNGRKKWITNKNIKKKP